MDVLSSWTVAVLIVTIIWFSWRKIKHSRFPPGPTGVPFLGVVPFLTKEPWKIFKQWSLEKYGPVMSVRIVNRDIIVLNNFEVIHQAFVKQSSQFSGRPYNMIISRLAGRNGIVLKEYDAEFKTHKHFALKTLRGFGLGCKSMEAVINEEADNLTVWLEKKCQAHSVNIKESMFKATAKIISKLSIGKQFDYDDDSCDYFLDAMKRLYGDQKDGDKLGILVMFDILRHVPPFAGVARRFVEREQILCDFMRERVEEHRIDFKVENCRDFIDAYFNEQQSGTGSNHESFTDDQLIFLLRELFVAGTETMSTTISWMVAILLHYPQHYKTLQEEIDSQFKGDEQLSMTTIKDMPFINAMLCEVFRFRTVTPVSMLHQTSMDSELAGYFIPKGITVVANIWGAHNDPDTWKNPEQFDPYRHIDEDGKFIPSKKIIPFSIGPRFCLGESLARVEFFFFTVKLLKSFTFMPHKKGLPSLEGMQSMVHSPYDYEVQLKKRK